MRMLVSGGAGFIGSNFLRYWSAAHPTDNLTCVDKLTYAGNFSSIADLVARKSVRFCRADIADLALMMRLLKSSQTVVHFAAESHVDRSIEDPTPFLHSNVVGTATLLEAARRTRVQRFHHVSTDEVYGTLPRRGGRRFGPMSPYAPRSPYAASKAAADHFVRAYFHTYGLPVTISSCGNNYGPYQHPEKLIPMSIIRALHDRSIPLYGDGRNVRDWIHVEDHCRAIDRILGVGTPGKTYVVGANNERSNLDVVGRILKLLPESRSTIEHVKDRPGHDQRYGLNPGRLRSELKWKPEISFQVGLASTMEWYRCHESWWRPLLDEPLARGSGDE